MTLSLFSERNNFSSITLTQNEEHLWKFIQTKEKGKIDEKRLIHNYHAYPGKFIPQIPQQVFERYLNPKNNTTIIDNFCGCGTSLVEAKLHGINSYGIDFNPLACLITKVKTTPINPDKLKKYCNNFVEMIERKKDKVLIPEFPNKTEWFHPDVLRELGIIYYHINKLKESTKFQNDVKDFLKLAFSSILVTVSGTDFNFIVDNMRPKELKYFDVFSIFKKKLKEMITAMTYFYNSTDNDAFVKVLHADSRDLNILEDNSIDLGITSPPYLNGLDYLKTHRLSFYWLGIDYQGLRENEIGARSKRGRRTALADYIIDMTLCFKEVYRILKKNSYYFLVIGNTRIDNESVGTNEILARVGKKVGFNFVKSIIMHIPGHFYKNHNKKIEWLLVFRK